MFSDCDECDSLRDAISEAESAANSRATEHYQSAYAAHLRDEHGSDPEMYD